tara:strand:- start:79835 stop:80707 length:873 start_codon:yes stop_codon:yes gene_type:complete
MNPSVFNDDGKILCNIRHTNYMLYHSELNKHNHEYGPLQYLHEEDNHALETNNFICELNPETYMVEGFTKVDMMTSEPEWNFTGLEDARLVRWDSGLVLTGVRRDTKPNGEGRIELTFLDSQYKEVYRQRIEPPKHSYCEKNWMPILDRPYRYIKWSSPTEVVTVYEGGQAATVGEIQPSRIDNVRDLRGGSHAIPYEDGYLAIVHECALYKNQLQQKDATYLHRFVYFNKDFKLTKWSREFSFMGGQIEFCCGMAQHGDNLLISYGFQDNAAFLLSMPVTHVKDWLYYD